MQTKDKTLLLGLVVLILLTPALRLSGVGFAMSCLINLSVLVVWLGCFFMRYGLTVLLFAGISSANAGTFSVVHPAAADWRYSVQTNGTSANTVGHFFAVNRYANLLYYTGLNQKARMVNPLAGDDFNAALMTLLRPAGVAKKWLNTGSFAAGDYSVTTGLTGNGISKYADTGFNLLGQLMSTNYVSMFISCFSTQAMGTTRFIIGSSDAANQATGVGVVASGRIDTAFVGATAAEYYPIAASNVCYTGLLGVNVNSFPINLGTTNKIDVNIMGVQGIAFDGTYRYDINSAQIYKLNYATAAFVSSNTTPFASPIGSNTHLGDGGYYNGYLYIGSETANNSPFYRSNTCIAIYDVSNLQLSNVFWVSNITAEVTACEVDVDHSTIYTVDYYQSNYVYKFSLTDGAYQGRIVLSPPIQSMQGLAYTNGYLFICGDSPTATGPGYLTGFAVNVTNGTVQRVVDQVFNSAENEGAAIIYTNVSFMLRFGGATNAYSYPITWAQTKAKRSQTYAVDGIAVGVPEISTAGFANYNVYVGCGNNANSPVVFTTRVMGDTYIGDGLTDVEMRTLGILSMQLNRTLGRR